MLDKDNTLTQSGVPIVGVKEFIKRQSAQRRVGVFSNASAVGIQDHLAEFFDQISVFSTQVAPLAKGSGSLYHEGRFYPKTTDLLEVTAEKQAEIERLRVQLEAQDHEELVLAVWHWSIAYEVISFSMKSVSTDPTNPIFLEEITRDLFSRVLLREFPYLDTPPTGANVQTVVEFYNRVLKERPNPTERIQAHQVNFIFAPYVDPVRDQLLAHRRSSGFNDTLEQLCEACESRWSFKDSGEPADPDELIYCNPHTPSSSDKDLFRLRLYLQTLGHPKPHLVMIDDWLSVMVNWNLPDTDPNTPVLALNPIDDQWIQRGNYEQLVNALFLDTGGPVVAFHKYLGSEECNTRREITIGGETFIFYKSPKSGLCAVSKSTEAVRILDGI